MGGMRALLLLPVSVQVAAQEAVGANATASEGGSAANAAGDDDGGLNAGAIALVLLVSLAAVLVALYFAGGYVQKRHVRDMARRSERYSVVEHDDWAQDVGTDLDAQKGYEKYGSHEQRPTA